MLYRKLSNTGFDVSVICLGTWAFGGDAWWGTQKDNDSVEVLDYSLTHGVNFIDTAPVYGRGRSERIIGSFLRKRKLREKVILATKVGLSWQGSSIYHDLSNKRIMEEIDQSRSRLETDYIDLYQVHWPDKKIPIANTAQTLLKLKDKNIIKSIGVSNYSLVELKEFLKYAPVDCIQPPYNMFNRKIEKELVPFCIENGISIISYVPLASGILSGKFFFGNKSIPDDLCRKNNKDLKEPYFSINKKTLEKLKSLADSYQKDLSQLAINWNFNQPGITSAIVGSRNVAQISSNLEALGWNIKVNELSLIDKILLDRQTLISKI